MAQFELHGAAEIQRKLKELGKPAKARSIARKALRQATNIVRDEARKNAKAIDDPDSKDKIWKNIKVQNGKSKDKNTVRMKVGVDGGASFSNPNPPQKSGGDTRHWRWVEFGSANNSAKPFMRPALENNVQQVAQKFVQVFNEELDKVLGP